MIGADVIVIGGGIAGISAAAAIAEGARVVLVEREAALGTHATGRSAAMFVDGYGNAAIRALSARSRPALADPDPAFWLGPLLARRGELLLARPGEEALAAAQVAAGAEAMTADDAAALAPILERSSIAAATYDREAADIDVDLLVQGLLRRLRRRDGAVLTAAEALEVRREGPRWRLRTTQGDAEAAIVVDAAGAWADVVAARAGVAPLGLATLRRSAAILPAPAGHDVGRWPLFGGIGEDWYALPAGGKLMVSPADEDPVPPQDARADDMVLAEGLARFEAMTTMAVTRVERSWAGLRSFLPDRTPAAGFDEGAEGFFWLAGQGGYGVQTAPALAELAADLVLGRTPALDAATVAALAPGRFARRGAGGGARARGD